MFWLFSLVTVSRFSPLSFTHPGLAKLGSGLRGTLRGYLYARNEQLARGFVAYADGVLLHRPTASDRLCITKIILMYLMYLTFALKFDKKLNIQLLSKKNRFGSSKMYSVSTGTCTSYFFVYFLVGYRVCWPLLYLRRPCVIFEGCLELDSNPKSCRRKQASYQFSHPSPQNVLTFLTKLEIGTCLVGVHSWPQRWILAHSHIWETSLFQVPS